MSIEQIQQILDQGEQERTNALNDERFVPEARYQAATAARDGAWAQAAALAAGLLSTAE